MEDTDTLIALVSSLLPDHIAQPEQDIILNALIDANGDVNSAVKLLVASESGPSNPKDNLKRKQGGLDDWLRPSTAKRSLKLKPDSSARDATPASASSSTKPQTPTVTPVVNLMTILKQAPSQTKTPPRRPPLTLSTPQLVAKHTPCTSHLSILPPELACKLFYTMIDLSQQWQRNKWWLFDRVVESPHLTSFFARKTDGLDDDDHWQEAAQFWYNGRPTDPPSCFPPEMEEACRIVEEIVCEQMKTREQYALEWGGRSANDPLWRANVAASNCYQGGKESVGFHSDQLTYLGPYPTIASLSLGTTRNFLLREVIPTTERESRKAQTFNIPLPHNSLTIMHASCQERFKHSIPLQPVIDLFRPLYPRSEGEPIEPSNCRINITFRFYRPDFRPPTIPKCHCGVPTILRPDMKNRQDDLTDRYWWTCYSGAQNEGKGCKFWKVLDMKEEGRGSCVGSV